jgi:transmembrane sensor
MAAVAIGVQVMGPRGPAAQPLATFAADGGAVRTVTLDDGTIARLAPGSRLEQWAAPGERRHTLRGKAFFAVRHDPERPFVVEAAGAEARVLGTRFELREQEGELRTVVVDGRVAVSNEAGRVEVPAGSVGDAGTRAAPSVRSVEDVYALLDWPGGLLVFQGTPLFRAAEEISRHFGRTVEIRGEELRELRVTAEFGEEAFEEVVQALCDVSGAGCSLTDSGALLTR